ncbi:hydroxymethylglutaryl-CoA lyase [Marinobacterium weihaiense]|uniref:Hydroxymethylglutaryl-CoA lyase n=1 Tax=Marinobacterium weihaiense TaxID=2851016 RepID=A0ABS6MDA4_9GAMM|nr:hydroxymethylglutaryl-CoA lyase [Marinobacterium weihaiense]MBV0934297.1 hydroxymethylglutaryl-CoA lyase [Marinobacterium weihaiense]
MFAHFPQQIRVNEVVTRDGFQSEPAFVPTETKIELINALARLGLSKVEVTSFVSPRAVPNLRDAEEVMRGITRDTDTTWVALVPNEKGCARALELAVDEINLVMSVSESHNLANMRMTCDQSLQQFARIAEMSAGTPMRLNGSLATAFGCPFEGAQATERVLGFIDAYLERGLHSITLADTTGMAVPNQVYDLCQAVRARWPELDVTLHFHNTRGLGLSNVLAALAAGMDQFDASLGGLGGCPFAPGATGNICTEDLVHMLHEMGLNTGVSLDGLLQQSQRLSEIVAHDLPGQIGKAGPRGRTRPLPESVQQLMQNGRT